MTGTNVFLSNRTSADTASRNQQNQGMVKPAPHVQEVTNLPVTINVGNVSQNSGIYVGRRNTAFGISSHSKGNRGFGSIGNSNVFIRNISFVYDPDYIDTPIDDRDVHILQQVASSGDSSVTNIGVGSVNVNTLQQNAGTFIGTTGITGMDSHEKQNLGHGQVFGNGNLNYQSLNLANDQDVIDAIMNDQDYKPGVFISG